MENDRAPTSANLLSNVDVKKPRKPSKPKLTKLETDLLKLSTEELEHVVASVRKQRALASNQSHASDSDVTGELALWDAQELSELRVSLGQALQQQAELRIRVRRLAIAIKKKQQLINISQRRIDRQNYDADALASTLFGKPTASRSRMLPIPTSSSALWNLAKDIDDTSAAKFLDSLESSTAPVRKAPIDLTSSGGGELLQEISDLLEPNWSRLNDDQRFPLHEGMTPPQLLHLQRQLIRDLAEVALPLSNADEYTYKNLCCQLIQLTEHIASSHSARTQVAEHPAPVTSTTSIAVPLNSVVELMSPRGAATVALPSVSLLSPAPMSQAAILLSSQSPEQPPLFMRLQQRIQSQQQQQQQQQEQSLVDAVAHLSSQEVQSLSQEYGLRPSSSEAVLRKVLSAIAHTSPTSAPLSSAAIASTVVSNGTDTQISRSVVSASAMHTSSTVSEEAVQAVVAFLSSPAESDLMERAVCFEALSVDEVVQRVHLRYRMGQLPPSSADPRRHFTVKTVQAALDALGVFTRGTWERTSSTTSGARAPRRKRQLPIPTVPTGQAPAVLSQQPSQLTENQTSTEVMQSSQSKRVRRNNSQTTDTHLSTSQTELMTVDLLDD